MSALAESWDDLDDDLAFSSLGEVPDGADLDGSLADRMLRRVLRERRAVAADEAVAQSQIDQVNAWLERRRAAHDTSYLEACLRQYHEARLAADPKAKTIHLPSGQLVARKNPDRVTVEDATAFFAEQGDDPALVRVKYEPDKPSILRHVKQTGHVPAGVTFVPGEVGFSVKADDVEEVDQ